MRAVVVDRPSGRLILATTATGTIMLPRLSAARDATLYVLLGPDMVDGHRATVRDAGGTILIAAGNAGDGGRWFAQGSSVGGASPAAYTPNDRTRGRIALVAVKARDALRVETSHGLSGQVASAGLGASWADRTVADSSVHAIELWDGAHPPALRAATLARLAAASP